MYCSKVIHRVAKVPEPPTDENKSSKKISILKDNAGHPLPLVDHLPEAALGSFSEVLNKGGAVSGKIDEASQAQPIHESDVEVAKNEKSGMPTENADDEVEPFQSSYYMIDKLLTKLINIAIEKNECQLRHVESLKELEKAKKLHDYLQSIPGPGGGGVMQRQEGAYIFKIFSVMKEISLTRVFSSTDSGVYFLRGKLLILNEFLFIVQNIRPCQGVQAKAAAFSLQSPGSRREP